MPVEPGSRGDARLGEGRPSRCGRRPTGDRHARPAPPAIAFDADCVLWGGRVRFVPRHERDRALPFAGAGSEEGPALAARHRLTRDDLGRTFLVVADGRALTRSDAAFAILAHLRAPWRGLRPGRIVPRPPRDAVYALVAARRHRGFGRRPDCAVVPPSERRRFTGVASAQP